MIPIILCLVWIGITLNAPAWFYILLIIKVLEKIFMTIFDD